MLKKKKKKPTTSPTTCVTNTWNAIFTKYAHMSPIDYISRIAEKTKAHATILEDD